MSAVTRPLTPRPLPWGRLALVLLISVLGHVLVLERVGSGLEADDATAGTPAVVSARLLQPPTPAAVAPAAPAKAVPQLAPRPAPVAPPAQRSPREPRAVPAPDIAAAPAATPLDPNAPLVVDGIAPEAPGGESAAPESAAATPSTPDAQPPPASQAEGDPAGASVNAERPQPEIAAAPGAAFRASGSGLLAEIKRNAAAVRLPVSARYVYNTRYSELSLSGTTTIEWQRDAMDAYKLRMNTTALGFALIELTSEGRLRDFGLAPDRYVETRTRRAPQAANFDWHGARVSFSARNRERQLAAGVQDRLSFQFQLMWLAQALPQRLAQDAKMVLPVAGRDDVADYQFRFAGREALSTGLGEIETIKIERLVDSSSDAHVEVWLAPGLDWLPVKLRFTDRQQRVTESVLHSMESSP